MRVSSGWNCGRSGLTMNATIRVWNAEQRAFVRVLHDDRLVEVFRPFTEDFLNKRRIIIFICFFNVCIQLYKTSEWLILNNWTHGRFQIMSTHETRPFCNGQGSRVQPKCLISLFPQCSPSKLLQTSLLTPTPHLTLNLTSKKGLLPVQI